MAEQRVGCYAIVPAGGSGERLGACVPKQYLVAGGKTFLEWSVSALLSVAWVLEVLVVVAPEDCCAAQLFHGSRVSVVPRGGKTRRETVLGGLAVLRERLGGGNPWVLVHDAARPGLEKTALERLYLAVVDDAVGGLLAMPVHDTIKRADAIGFSIAQTIPRERLWCAQTPQMFRLAQLWRALEGAIEATDESCAVEKMGAQPKLVEGSAANFKVTTKADWFLMRQLLEQRVRHAGASGEETC